MINCPQCGSDQTSKIDAPTGMSDYFIGTIDRSNGNSINPTSGMALQAYGCLNCKGVWFKNKNISPQ